MRNRSWRVGFAETDITPANNEAFLAGFGQPRFATGKLAPLLAQALVLEDAHGQRAVLVTADVTGFDRTTVDALRFRLQRDFAVEPEAAMFAASHTHFGPGVQLRHQLFCGIASPWYMARYEQMIHATVGRAVKDLSQAKLSFSAADTAIGCNRRVHDSTGRVKFGMEPNLEGVYDRHTPVWHVQRRGAKADIIVVGHACHPTSVGVYDKWSPDYPGAMRRELSRQRGARGMFVMGAGGAAKVCHVDPQTSETVFTNDPRNSGAAGRKLARAVLKHLDGGDTVALLPTLSCALARGKLSLQPKESPAQHQRLATEGDLNNYMTWTARQYVEFPCYDDRLDYDVQTWRLGDELTVVGMEGEVCAPWGAIARGLANTPHAAVIGYVNATRAYIVDKQMLWEGGYEADHRNWALPGPFTPKIDAQVKRIIRRAVAAL